MAKSTNKTELANTESKTSFSFLRTRETSGKEKPLKSNQAGGCEYVCSETAKAVTSYVALVTMQKVLATDSGGCWCF